MPQVLGKGAPITASFMTQTMPPRKDSQVVSARSAMTPPAPAGVQKQVTQPGFGESVKPGDIVSVSYVGWLAGSSPENAFDQGSDFRFCVGNGEVIPGWDQAAAGMREGEMARLVIPSHLAYGATGAGGVIPPNADLCFDVQLNGIINASPSGPPSAPAPVAAPVAGVDEPIPAFTSSARFAGPREGQSFRMGEHGLGYYRDGLAPRSTPAATTPRSFNASVTFEARPKEPEIVKLPGAAMAAQRGATRIVPTVGVDAVQTTSQNAASAAANYARRFAGQGDFTRRSFTCM